MPDVITLGEALMDFVSIESGVEVKEAPGFLKAPGGAPANVAAALGKLGVKVAFLGKVGDDPFGHFLQETLEANGVDTSGMRFDPEARTTLAFVSLREDGEHSFVFYRHPGADMLLRPEEINRAWISSTRIFHFGSISAISEPSRSATRSAIRYAQEAGALVSYDPNLRLSLWPDAETARQEMTALLPEADLVKINDEELHFLTGTDDLPKGGRTIIKQGPKAVIITLGPEGCFFTNGKEELYVEGIRVEAIDTTGAGDAFWAAVLWGALREIKAGTAFSQIPISTIEAILRTANRAGALTTTKKGVIPALPTLEEMQG